MRPGATIELASSVGTPLDFFTGRASLTNLGTMNLSVAGSHAIRNSIAFNNGGMVNVNAGDARGRRQRHRTGVYALVAGTGLTLRRHAQARGRLGHHGCRHADVSGATVSANGSLDDRCVGCGADGQRRRVERERRAD